MNNILVRAIMAPGMWLQTFTTREPDEKQIEVALTALNEVLATDQQTAEQAPAEVAT